MWLFVLMTIVFFYGLYNFLEFWIFKPWRIHRDFWSQGIPGRYIPFVGEALYLRDAVLADDPMSYGTNMLKRFGDYYHASFGYVPRLVTMDPSLSQCVLKTNARFYHKSPLVSIALNPILDVESLLLTEDNIHARHRRLLAPVFQHQNLMSMVSLMASTVYNLCEKWSLAMDDGNTQNRPITLDIHKEMSLLTLEVVVRCVFGGEMNSDNTRAAVSDGLTTCMENIEARLFNMVGVIPILNKLPLPSKLRIDRAKRTIKNAAETIIQQRKAGLTKSSCKGSDLLDLLLNTHDKSTEKNFTDKELVEETLTFVLAGHETTANLLTWTLFDLANNPDVCCRLEAEVDSVLSGDEEVTMSTLSLLSYTELVLKESLRVHPPVAFLARKAIEDNTIVASDVIFILSKTNSSEKYWDRPEQYDPSRFNESHSDAFLPFGSGPRLCIGQHFAMIEAKIILAMLIKRYRFELVPGQKPVPAIAITLRPKYGMWMKVTQREKTRLIEDRL